jgi:hypothetical protein
MEYELFINNLMNKTKKLKEENYEKYGYIEPIFKKEVVIVDYSKENFKNSVDFKTFHMDLKKQAKYEKTKPGKARIIDYEEDEDCKKVNLLTDDIFETNVKEEDMKVKIDVKEMSIKELMKEINKFIQKKNIYLSDEDAQLIKNNVEDPVFEREKYIKFSKTTKMLSKLEFIKKSEDGLYEVDFDLEHKENKEEKKKYVHKHFFK